jgi:signal transduction histidine kinase
MPTIPFTVDSALLRELGERLVGKPHIALAELVKNSYDADATLSLIRFRTDEIEVADNGHGMDFREFKRFWMRIGTPHKQEDRFSPYLNRPMSGSKGVGRLAVQFLGRLLRMETVSRKNARTQLTASVNWEDAVEAGELTQAEATYEQTTRKTSFLGSSHGGTRIIISGLNQQWDADDFRGLAREIWWLQPPFRSNPELTEGRQRDFKVSLEGPSEEEAREFESQMRAYLDIWHARIVGKLAGGNDARTTTIALSLEFSDGEQIKRKYKVEGNPLHALEFEIRVYDLRHRQAHGIKVDTAREYFNKFGGVHVYDGGFHLPYYGPDTDWLRIEIDHSHRLSQSRLLPSELQLAGGMSHLPTQSRIFGVVHVSTAKEAAALGREEYLQIQVTRDRLVDNDALETLRKAVRWALDFYAMEQAKRAFEAAEASRPVEPFGDKVARVEQVLAEFRSEIPEAVYKRLGSEVEEAIQASEAEDKISRARTGLLGGLATAGIAALSYQHEVYKQFTLLEDIARVLRKIEIPNHMIQARVAEVINRLEEWLERARHTRALFSPLLDEENRTKRERFKARFVVERVKEQTQVLLHGIDIETAGIENGLRLPSGTLAEWSAVFQNVFINAANAVLDANANEKRIAVSSDVEGPKRRLLVQDTGGGVDLDTAEELFEPFVRKLQISQARRALGLGGTGLGLTIVRMVARELSCDVAFVAPTPGFKTAFQLSWSEKR